MKGLSCVFVCWLYKSRWCCKWKVDFGIQLSLIYTFFFILFLTRLFIAECFGGQFRAVELAGLFSHGGLSVSLRATILRHGKSQLPHIKMAIGT